MNWNQNDDNWAELKVKAKQQETEIKSIKQRGFVDIRDPHISRKTNNTRAEVQLSELHDLLKVMGNIQSEINNSFYK